MAESEGVVKPAEFETTALGREELKEKDWGAGVSSAENLHEDKRDFFNIFHRQKLQCLRWNPPMDEKVRQNYLPLIQIQFHSGWGGCSEALRRWSGGWSCPCRRFHGGGERKG